MARAPFLSTLFLPSLVALMFATGLILSRDSFYLVAVSVGLAALFVAAYESICERNWSLDYIAFLAMVLSVFSHELLAGAVIALMYTGGRALETYASERAERSLAGLLARIPKTVWVQQPDGTLTEQALASVSTGSTIIVRGGELIPLDGRLSSEHAVLNLANLTGEPLPETLREGAIIKSGSINVGPAFALTVSGTLASSTYAKIVNLVKDAAKDQAPFVRLAEKANIPFTALTLIIGGAVYLFTGEWMRVLAVLVIATPCPLIIAAPVAFIGGLSRAAGKNIIIKRPAALETIAQVTTVFFDKTGTLTIGEPQLSGVQVLDTALLETDVLAQAAALEFHSIHPLARTLVAEARKRGIHPTPAGSVVEILGAGIQGVSNGHTLAIGQAPDSHRKEGGITLLLTRDGEPAASFHFADVLKPNAKELISDLTQKGCTVAVLTGDHKENAEAIFAGLPLQIFADCTPEEKYRIVEDTRARGARVAMIGDGLNDAPALARADVGIVFSGTENSASIEAADVAILGHDLLLIQELFQMSRRSMRIASESVYAGITLSVIGMLVAAGGAIVPVVGAILQECIDVVAILNALRAAFKPRRPRLLYYSS